MGWFTKNMPSETRENKCDSTGETASETNELSNKRNESPLSGLQNYTNTCR